jgi:hypothetical protein
MSQIKSVQVDKGIRKQSLRDYFQVTEIPNTDEHNARLVVFPRRKQNSR